MEKRGIISMRETKGGISMAINDGNTNIWMRNVKIYFENLKDYVVTTRKLKHGEQIGIRKEKIRKRDFVVTIYNSGTISIQTKKTEEWMNHMNKIVEDDVSVLLESDTIENENSIINMKDNDEEREERERNLETPKEIEIKENDQNVFNKNIELEIEKMMSIIGKLSTRLEDMEKEMNELKKEN